MKRIVILGCTIALAGCATLKDGGKTFCENKEATLLALDYAETEARKIMDDNKRITAIAGIGAARAALSECPPNPEHNFSAP